MKGTLDFFYLSVCSTVKLEQYWIDIFINPFSGEKCVHCSCIQGDKLDLIIISLSRVDKVAELAIKRERRRYLLERKV